MSVGDLIEKFRGVALERVERMNEALVLLDRQGDDDEQAKGLLREIHTLKGEAKMMGFADVNLVAHLTESMLIDFDERDFDVPDGAVNVVFQGFDTLRGLLTKSAGTAAAPVDLTGFVDNVVAARSVLNRESGSPRVETGEFRSVEIASPAPSSTGLRIQSSGSLRVELYKLERLGEVSGEMLLMTRRIDYHMQQLEDLRVDFEDWVGRVQQNLPKSQGTGLRGVHHRLEKLLAESHEDIYLANLRASQVDEETRKLRHVSLAQVLSHYPRAVRDLALSQGKRVRLVHGFGDVEVDRVILGGLSDPLLHLVRNAVDHGIESPEERLAVGKDDEGEIRLVAEYAGDSILVELSDDGRGISPDLLRDRAVEKEFRSREDADAMSDAEALQLIFESGFTTRDSATDVSGRGIGMDVVRREISQLGGAVDIISEVGKGTTFRMMIPVSSAISKLLMVVVGQKRYGIPAKDIERVDVIDRDAVSSLAGGGFVLRYGGELIALLDWAQVLGHEPRSLPPEKLTVLIVRRSGRLIAVWVDDVVGEREAMTRPLGEFLSGIRVCRGMALTDAGEVVPMLNATELVQFALEEGGSRVRMNMKTTRSHEDEIPARILVVEDSEITRSLVCSILRGLDYDVIEAEDGYMAWTRLQSEHIDLILSDVQMPRVDGLQLLSKVRSDPRFERLPVVMLTTLSSAADQATAMKLGANGYLGKLNFDEKELIRTVRRYLGS